MHSKRSRRRPSRVALLALAFVFASAKDAQAFCLNPAGCICPASSAAAIFTGTVLSVSDNAEVRLDRVVPIPSSTATTLQAGDQIMAAPDIPWAVGPKYQSLRLSGGERVLGYSVPGDPESAAIVNVVAADDSVTCNSLRLSLAEAEQEMLRSDCFTRVGERLDVPCNDVIDQESGGCVIASTAPPAVTAALPAALLAAGMVRRRQRKKLSK
jgi:hypothetical protein